MPTQMARSLDGGAGPPSAHDLRRDVGEQARRQADSPRRRQLGDLLFGCLQADVSRVGLDAREQFRPIGCVRVGAGLVGGVRDQCEHARDRRGWDAGDDPSALSLFGPVQCWADDSCDPVRGGWLDLLLTAALQ